MGCWQGWSSVPDRHPTVLGPPHSDFSLLTSSGLVFKAHRLLYHTTLGSREIKKKKKKDQQVGRNACSHALASQVPARSAPGTSGTASAGKSQTAAPNAASRESGTRKRDSSSMAGGAVEPPVAAKASRVSGDSARGGGSTAEEKVGEEKEAVQPARAFGAAFFFKPTAPKPSSSPSNPAGTP